MPVPDFQSLLLPTLKALSGGGEMPLSDVRARIAENEGLTSEDLREMLGSGQSVFTNRASWAVIYMERAGLLERVRRGVYRLTPEGERLLSRSPSHIDMALLREYPGFSEWSRRAFGRSPGKEAVPEQSEDVTETPEETLDRAARQLSNALEADVLHRIRSAAPAFLERVAVDLLIAMGYGGGAAAQGRVTGRSGDGGIDGTIREDALGLDQVYVQAKKYAAGNTVGGADLRNFAGASTLRAPRRACSSPRPRSRLRRGTTLSGARSASSSSTAKSWRASWFRMASACERGSITRSNGSTRTTSIRKRRRPGVGPGTKSAACMQAGEYFDALPDRDRPRHLLVSDFQTFELRDRAGDRPSGTR